MILSIKLRHFCNFHSNWTFLIFQDYLYRIMKPPIFFLSASFCSLAYSFPQFENLCRSGVLSAEDEAILEAVKRDSAAYLNVHEREAGSEKEKRQGGFLGGLLGGGLCE